MVLCEFPSFFCNSDDDGVLESLAARPEDGNEGMMRRSFRIWMFICLID